MSKQNEQGQEPQAARGDIAAQKRDELIFALDIGTRSVIGVVGAPEGDQFRVQAVERMDHPKRAMIDGQIEDIEQTARVAGAVKQRLEKRLGRTLREVCVAAAGRALKTQPAVHETALDPGEPITAAAVSAMETAAVQSAYEALGEKEGEDGFYCVGYSVVRYVLDDYPISTLDGHRGRLARAEIIATFLPNAVVESLYTTMNRTGLSVASLTLEPIAAMNAIIPRELRLLNLALVDIGAGTSDIAVCKEGAVAAYTMATVAGDEITEAIIREYLVDFETAEQIKLALGQNAGEIKYHDILGFLYTASPQEVADRIRPTIDTLVGAICERILACNGQPPAAVFLVGGGSQIPGLCEGVADRLSIDRTKVAVGSSNYMKRSVLSDEDISGPDYATPMGIALTAVLERARDNFAVRVNGEEVRAWRSGGMNVMDALICCGYKNHQIIGRSGQSVTFELNGAKKTVRGSLPTAAEIQVGGKAAILSTPLRSGDSITITPAQPGNDAAPKLRDLADEWEPFTVLLDGRKAAAGTRATVNGAPETDPERAVRNLDSVEIRRIATLGDLLAERGADPAGKRFYVRDQECGADYELSPGDEIEIYDEALSRRRSAERAAEAAPPPPEAAAAPEAPRAAGRRGLTVSLNGRTTALMPKPDGTPYQFLDMLNFVDIDPTRPQGNIVLLLNDAPASYLDIVSDGDRVEIRWKGR